MARSRRCCAASCSSCDGSSSLAGSSGNVDGTRHSSDAIAQSHGPHQRLARHEQLTLGACEIEPGLLVQSLFVLEIEIGDVLRGVLLDRHFRGRPGGLHDRAALRDVLRCGDEVVIRRADIRAEAQHLRRHAHLRGVERGAADRAAARKLDQVDERLRETQLVRPIRLAGNAQLELEDRIGDRAGLDEVRARDARAPRASPAIADCWPWRSPPLRRRVSSSCSIARTRSSSPTPPRHSIARSAACAPTPPAALRSGPHRAERSHTRRGARLAIRHRHSLHFLSFLTRVIPHFGHLPGVALVTSGCIGQA